MYGRILKVYPGSLAEELELVPGDKLLEINGIKLRDIIDVSFAFAKRSSATNTSVTTKKATTA